MGTSSNPGRRTKRQGGDLRTNAVSIKNTMMDYRGLRRIYLYMRRANGKRVVLLLASFFLALLVFVLFGTLFVQDLALGGHIFPGITIDGRAVGGMSKAEAVSTIRKTVASPLMEPLVLVHDAHKYKLDLASINVSIDVEAMVENAYGKGRQSNFLVRMFRRFMNKPIYSNIPVMVKYDAAKLEAFVTGIAEDINVAPRSSYVDMSKGRPSVSSSKYGLSVKQAETRDAIVAALPTLKRRIPILVESLKPKTTESDIGYIIVIKQSEHKLYFYNGDQYIDAFDCSLGTPQYPTPNGQFTIVKKEKDPTWYPPKSEWAKDKKPVPPGPGNPLGPYWMGIGGEVGIHSTADEKSLGYSASHGCIRVSEWAAMYLFNRVSKGTPVYIYP
jgi:lipoprotein-anchoring transpeptidase ErfK/SrfK